MGGVKLIVIEAKCFNFILEDGRKAFFFQITKRGRGFIKSLLLGRDASYWLMSTFKDKALFASPSFIRRFKGDGKLFVVYHGRNHKGRYVLVTEFFDNGRRSSIIVPEGSSFAGWNHFGKALSDLLVVNPSKGISPYQELPYCQPQ